MKQLFFHFFISCLELWMITKLSCSSYFLLSFHCVKFGVAFFCTSFFPLKILLRNSNRCRANSLSALNLCQIMIDFCMKSYKFCNTIIRKFVVAAFFCKKTNILIIKLSCLIESFEKTFDLFCLLTYVADLNLTS